jgi:hypothetical protein
MSSQAESLLRGPVLRFAPEVFQAELSGWLSFGERPDDELLWAILRNDLLHAFAYAPKHNYALVHATLAWLLNFAPPQAYGSAEAVGIWVQKGGLGGRKLHS